VAILVADRNLSFMYSFPNLPELRTAAPLSFTHYAVLSATWMRFQREQLRLQRELLLRAEMARRSARLNQYGDYLAAVYGVTYVKPSLRHPTDGETPHVDLLGEIIGMMRRGQPYNLSFALARKRLADAAAEFNAWADREAALIGLIYVRPNLRRHALHQAA